MNQEKMEFNVFYKGKEKKISLDYKDKQYVISDEKKKEIFNAAFIDSNTISLINNGNSILARIIKDDSKTTVYIDGEEYKFDEVQEKEKEFQSGTKSDVLETIIKSPMPGNVVKINVKEGDKVKEGDILVIVEAMKMENELRASANMKVKKVYVKEGEQVEGFAPMIELMKI
jgi:acetyl/propionyl-CoA carboxylase alpha subunit